MLETELRRLGNRVGVQALQAAYGITSDAHTLTERRANFAAGLQRHPDTIEAWENEVIDELAEQLLSRELIPLALPLRIGGWVQNRQFATIQLFVDTGDEQGPQQLHNFLNTSTDPSLPCLLFMPTGGLKPPSLVFHVFFEGDIPSRAWLIVSSSPFNLVTGQHREQVSAGKELHVGVKEVQEGSMYCLFWEW